ncbi:MAG: FAD-binding protein [Holophagales bacterium]|nr:FAD-binding protein [Holophagales bacterium]MYI32755.1 FAD-binding protein [Holophagales bacterium]
MTGAPSRPGSAAEVAEAVGGAERIVPRGGGTKPALWSVEGAYVLDLSALSGITEYLPSEYTVTALAGTPLADVDARLAAEGQYLPFDPLLVEAGSTVGGAVAAGANGPGRLRYGGLRDFLLAVTFVDGRGEIVRGGAKVVKNAAGFDLPKLMVGSLGRLGVLTECTFKVFPHPESCATLRVAGMALDEAIEAAGRVGAGAVEIECLDLAHGLAGWDLEIRIGGRSFALDARLKRAADLLDTDVSTLSDDADARHWRARREFGWASTAASVLKLPLTPATAGALEQVLADLDASQVARVYSAGIQQAFVAWPAERVADLPALDRALSEAKLTALALRAPAEAANQPILGHRTGGELLRRVEQALDPAGRFGRL